MEETSQIIDKFYDELAEEIRSAYAETLNKPGYQIKIYIWEDGEIETLPGPAGDQSWLQPKRTEERGLYYITTVRGFNAFWELWTDGPEPEDEATRKAFLDWVLDDFDEFDELERIKDKWLKQEVLERIYSHH